MDWDPKKWLAPKSVSTPNIVEDIHEYLDINFSNEKYNSLDNDKKRKLTVLVERIEFIKHLEIMSEYLRKNKTVTYAYNPLSFL